MLVATPSRTSFLAGHIQTIERGRMAGGSKYTGSEYVREWRLELRGNLVGRQPIDEAASVRSV